MLGSLVKNIFGCSNRKSWGRYKVYIAYTLSSRHFDKN